MISLDSLRRRRAFKDVSPYQVLERRVEEKRKLSWKEKRAADSTVDHQLLLDCLIHHLVTREPLPLRLLFGLMADLEIVLTGHKGSLFKKPSGMTKRRTHPLVGYIEYAAVGYILSCQKHGWDDHPIKTIIETYGVKRSTVYRWKKKYPDAGDNLDKDQLQEILDKKTVLMYQALKPI